MKCHSLYFFLVFKVVSFVNAEPLQGKNIVTADPRDFPFIASLGFSHLNDGRDREHFCTGTLIAKLHILTAEHCLTLSQGRHFDVVIGYVDASEADIKYEVDSWITYEDWIQRLGKVKKYSVNDIAIVKLVPTVIFQAGIAPVAFSPMNDQQLQRTRAVMVGWSLTNDVTSPLEVLFKASVTILTTEKCQRHLKLVAGEPLHVTSNHLCTFATPYVLGNCGDSGGPLLDENNNLVGVYRGECPNTYWGNFSHEFLNQYKISFHSSVDYYRKFIKSVINVAQGRVSRG